MAKTALAPDHAIIWEPQPGPQTALITCPVAEVFYGGARGGGKTDGVLGEWVSHAAQYGENAIGLMIRRQRTELVETIERSRQIYALLGAKYHEQDKMWRFPNGARLRFAYLERDADAEAYQGHSYTRLYVEEIGNFPSDRPILKMMATLRSGAGVPCGFRATGNPGGPGHQWVKARYIDPAPMGWQVITDPASGLQRVYIPSRVSDNHYLGEDYVQRLRGSGSEELVRAWLGGDWSVIDGAFFDCWGPQHVIPPFSIPDDWARFRSADWGSASPFSVGWWVIAGDDFSPPGHVGSSHHKRLGSLERAHDRIVIPRGALVRYREWYGASAPNKGLKLTAEQVAEGIVEREATEPKKSIQGVMDPSAFKEDGGPSLAERINRVLAKAQRGGFRPADNSRVAKTGAIGGWDQMRARMVGNDGVPMIYCFSTCVDSIRTIPALQHDQNRAEDVNTDSEDHAADEWRYACMSRPWMPPLKVTKETRRDRWDKQPSDDVSWKVA